MFRPALISIALVGLSFTHGSFYHIDFLDGNNSADGLSTATAWKHAPGDPAATDKPATTILQPGDVLRFKGGVAYHGRLVFNVSGTPDAPIVLNGNSDRAWGEGPAILDGGRIIDSWKPLSGPSEAEGNPRWNEMISAVIEVDIEPNLNHGQIVLHRKVGKTRQVPWQRVILIEGESGLLPVAQFPKPSDPFFPDRPGDFVKVPEPIVLDPETGRTRINDPDTLANLVPTSLEDGFVGFHAGNHHVFFGRILEHNRETGTIEAPPYKGALYPKTRYAVYNSPALISQPGEWSIRSLGEGRSEVVLLPPEHTASTPETIAFPDHETAITIQDGASHYRISGFRIKRYSGGNGGIAVARSKTRSRDVTINNCEIRNLTGMAGILLNYCDDITVRDCFIHHNPGWTVGIFLNRVNDYLLENNRLVKNSGSGIRHYECKNGHLRSNVLVDHHGIHSSGMNFYTGSRDILVEDNFLTDIITVNRSAERLTFRNNVVDLRGRNGFCLAFWISGNVGGRHIHDIQIENNTLVRSGWSAFMVQGREGVPEPEGVVLRNNILHGASSGLPDGVAAHSNLFTREPDHGVAGGNLHVPDLLSLIRDPDTGDYRRVPQGPMPEAGAQGHQYQGLPGQP